MVGFFQVLSQSANVLDLTLPYPAPQVIDLVKLLFLNLGNIVKLDCIWVSGFYGNIILNTIVVPTLIAGVCGFIYIYRRKKLTAADASSLELLKVQLQQNLFFCVFLVCELSLSIHPRIQNLPSLLALAH